ncbi:hypothetical protein KM043_002899 [Ampulex compressa]|nr:hypothetical protein KM043_002899 [Ampulex compressa]
MKFIRADIPGRGKIRYGGQAERRPIHGRYCAHRGTTETPGEEKFLGRAKVSQRGESLAKAEISEMRTRPSPRLVLVTGRSFHDSQKRRKHEARDRFVARMEITSCDEATGR